MSRSAVLSTDCKRRKQTGKLKCRPVQLHCHIVESRVYQSTYEHLERGCRHLPADLAQLAESSEALWHRSFAVYDRTGMTETIDGHCRRYQKLTAAAATGSNDWRCQTLPSCPVGRGQTRRHESTRNTAVSVEFPGRKPHCKDGKRSKKDRYFISWRATYNNWERDQPPNANTPICVVVTQHSLATC